MLVNEIRSLRLRLEAFREADIARTLLLITDAAEKLKLQANCLNLYKFAFFIVLGMLLYVVFV